MKHTTKLLVMFAAVLGAFGLAATGWAFWTASGSGSASATVGTLPAPVLSPPSTVGSTVTLNWTAVTPPGTGNVTYSVIRSTGSLAGTCASSSIAGTTCDDTGVADGDHSYTVTAKFQSWTATSNLQSVTVIGGSTVTGVSSTVADGTYGIGASIPVTVTFSAPVNVTGAPQLALSTINPTMTAVNYTSGSGTNTLTFTYTVAAGNNTVDLNYDSTAALTLNGGTIKNVVGGTDATLALPAPAAAGSLGSNKDIVIDGVAPAVWNVTSATADGTYTSPTVIPVTVTFSEAVNVIGAPQLALNSGGSASYATGTGSNLLTFNYTVAAGQTSADLDYSAVSSLTLNGGTIKDTATNNATLTLPTPGGTGSLGANQNIVIDTTGPTVTNVTSTTANGTYATGTLIPVTVTFSESVNVTGVPVTGAPLLALNSGGGASAIYASGTGTSTLTFNYTVAAGQTSADLDYSAVSSLTLNGGTIKDSATNNATLTLPTPGGPGSLGANRAIVIDTTAPVVSVTKVNGTTRTFPYATNANVTSVGGACGSLSGDQQTVAVTINAGAAIPATASCSSGTWTLTLTTALAAQGSYDVVATQVDAAGNTGTSTTNTITIDTTPPTAANMAISCSFPNGSNYSCSGTYATATGDASSSLSVTIYKASNNTVVGDAVTTPSTISGGNWSGVAGSGLAKDTYYAKLTQSDAAGNTTTIQSANFTRS